MNRYIKNINERVDILFNNHNVALLEKIQIISALRMTEKIKKMLLNKRLIIDKTNGDYFKIGKYKIFFTPDYKIQDSDYLLHGITTLLAESFFLSHFFHKGVQLKKGDICFDVGSNIGTTCLLFSDKVGPNGKIYAFEPVTHDVLQKNMDENAIKNVQVIPKAVAEKNGITEIEISDFCLDSSIAHREYKKDYYTNSKNVEVTNLDEFVKLNSIPKVDFIKMDIEGAEELAIKGADKIIKEHRPVWSVSSYHIDAENEPQHPKLVKLFKSYGYTVNEFFNSHIYAWMP